MRSIFVLVIMSAVIGYFAIRSEPANATAKSEPGTVLESRCIWQGNHTNPSVCRNWVNKHVHDQYAGPTGYPEAQAFWGYNAQGMCTGCFKTVDSRSAVGCPQANFCGGKPTSWVILPY